MLTQNITYKDFNGRERTEPFFFNLTVMDVVDLELESEKGLKFELEQAIAGEDYRKLLEFVKKLIGRSYGIKSDDGRRHLKNPEILAEFQSGAWYSDFLMGLFENEGKKGVAFIQGVLPASLINEAGKKIQSQSGTPNARERWAQHVADKNIPAPTVDTDWEQKIASLETATSPVSPETREEIQHYQNVDVPEPLIAPNGEVWTEAERDEYFAFKRNREAAIGERDSQNFVARPPHESGPGVQFDGA